MALIHGEVRAIKMTSLPHEGGAPADFRVRYWLWWKVGDFRMNVETSLGVYLEHLRKHWPDGEREGVVDHEWWSTGSLPIPAEYRPFWSTTWRMPWGGHGGYLTDAEGWRLTEPVVIERGF